jgi:hypothetical protein
MIIELAIALPALSLVVHNLATAGSHLVLGILRHRKAGAEWHLCRSTPTVDALARGVD